MPSLLLCDDTPPKRCPPTFRVRASSWIDSGNFGASGAETDPPAGIRLRWTCPFVAADLAAPIDKPMRYEVQRSEGPLAGELWLPGASAGHLPRMPTPTYMWRPLEQDGLTWRVLEAPCIGVDAVYFVMPPGGGPVTVTLITIDGRAVVTGEVYPGDAFHYEQADIRGVAFSKYPGATEVLGFQPSGLDAPFQTIAEIDAATWFDAPRADLLERIANAAGEPFDPPSDTDLAQLQRLAGEIGQAFDAGSALPPDSVGALQLIAASSWKAAALAGWAFVDGNHPPVVQLDQINAGLMLQGPDDGLYAYRIVAIFESEARETSIPCLAHAAPARNLVPIDCRFAEEPVTRSELTNILELGDPETPRPASPPEQRTFCTGRWRLATALPDTELMLTRPVAEDSAITGGAFVDPGLFRTGADEGPRRFHRLEWVETRTHIFDVPYFDCDVGLEVISGDAWDRRLKGTDTGKLQPRIDYRGSSIPLARAACDPGDGTLPKVEVEFDRVVAWTADPLATHARAVIRLMMRRPDEEAMEAHVALGPPSPTSDGDWTADVTTGLPQAGLDHFVGGTLVVAGLSARILGFGPLASGRSRCSFEATVACAGAVLYLTPGGSVLARLYENPQSPRLWIELQPATTSVLPSGLPSVFTATANLPELKHSQTLHFATRLQFTFEGRPYESALSSPLAAPYLYPAPEPPQTCFEARQLGSDYYGRTVVRAVAAQCPQLESHALRLTLAGIADPLVEDETKIETEFVANEAIGDFGPQRSILRRQFFELFEGSHFRNEGSRYRVGLRYVRDDDGRESRPAIHEFTIRRVE